MKKTTKLLIATSVLAIITSNASANVMEITTLPNPCELLADATCEIDENGEAVIIGDGSENKPTFEDKRAILVNSLETYTECALESETNKDLKNCKKSYKKSLK